MKELSQIRMAVLDALRGAGIQAMEAFPEKQAMAYSGVVAAVGRIFLLLFILNR